VCLTSHMWPIVNGSSDELINELVVNMSPVLIKLIPPALSTFLLS